MRGSNRTKWIAACLTVLVGLGFGTLTADALSAKIPTKTVVVSNHQGAARFSGEDLDYLTGVGEPAIPFRMLRVLLPPNADEGSVTVSLRDLSFEEVEGEWLVNPVKPPATWDGENVVEVWPEGKNIVDGRDVDAYQKDAFFPKSPLGRIHVGQLRKWTVLAVPVALFRYNPVTKRLFRLTSEEIDVQYDIDASRANRAALRMPDRIGEERVRGSVINFPTGSRGYGRLVTRGAEPQASGYAIITTNAIASASSQLNNFIELKRSRGFEVHLATEDDWGGGTGNTAANRIRSWLKNNYLAKNLEYAVLIGNPHPSSGDVPMKMLWPRNNASYYTQYKESPSDYFYADLTGNWDLDGDGRFGEWGQDFGSGGVDRNYEVAIGRIPYYGDMSDLDAILAKIIDYQSAMSDDTLWRHKALLPMEPSDGSTPGYHLGQQIKSTILAPKSWGSHRVYESAYGLNPPPETVPCTVNNVKNAWNNFRPGAIFWWTHGSSTTAVDIMTSYTAPSLHDSHPGFTFQCSCNNGYPEVTNNLGYSLLKNGCVATVSATRVSWYYPGETDFRNTCTNAGFTYRYAKRMISGEEPSGKSLFALKQNLSPYGAELWMNFTVMNLYGDPECGLFSFREGEGSITCAISPERAIDNGAQWRLVTGPDIQWKNSGDVIENVPIGDYEITFKDAVGYHSPDNQHAAVEKDQLAAVNGTYTMMEPRISVTAPVNGVMWGTSEERTITWNSINIDGDVAILLLKNGSVLRTITDGTPNDGEFLWTIPAGIADGTDYQIRVSSAEPAVTDDSDGEFTILTFMSLTMGVSPAAGGTTTPSGTARAIRNEPVDVFAAPAHGFFFDRWEFSGEGTIADATEPSTHVTLTGDASLTAKFTQYIFLEETFEDNVMPPEGWTKFDGASTPGNEMEPAHWNVSPNFAKSGRIGAHCPWGYNLDEWLVSPRVDLSATKDPVLSFWWKSSYFWHVAPNDNGDLFLKISVDGGNTWTPLWTFGDIGEWEDWKWYQAIIDLADYVGQSDVRIAFHVVANQNARIAIDDVMLTDKAATLTVKTTGSGICRPDVGTHVVQLGEPLALIAVPMTGGRFIKWTSTGAVTIDEVEKMDTTAMLTGDATITAVFDELKGEAVLTMATAPSDAAGSTSPQSGTLTLPTFSPQNIEATPASGFHFVRWEVRGPGRIVDLHNPQTAVVLLDDATVTARFVENGDQATLTMAVIPSEAEGTVDPGVGERQAYIGEFMKIKATPTDGYHFVGWQGEGAVKIDDVNLPETSAIPVGDATLTAVFAENTGDATLTMLTMPVNGGSTNPGIGDHDVKIGASYRIAAFVEDGFHFRHWTVVGGGWIADRHRPVTSVKIYGDAKVFAHFVENVGQCRLTLAASPEEGGFTNPGVGERVVAKYDTVRLEAVAAKDYHFAYWTVVGGGEIADIRSPSTLVTLQGDAVVHANFLSSLEKTTLVMKVFPPGAGTSNPGEGNHEVVVGGTYPVAATVTPDTDYEFIAWRVEGQGEMEETRLTESAVTVNGPTTVTAIFGILPTPATLTMVVDPAGTGATNPGEGTHMYSVGKTIAITAQADKENGYCFTGWSSTPLGELDDVKSEKTTVILRGNATVTAHFSKSVGKATLTMRVVPEGFGSTNPGVGVHEVVLNKPIEITAVPGEGYVFDKWIGAGCVTIDNPALAKTKATPCGNAVVSAIFKEVPIDKVYVEMKVTPEESGSTNPGLGRHEVDLGTTMVIKAEPSEGYKFERWQTCCSIQFADPKLAATTATINGGGDITAVFSTVSTKTNLIVKPIPADAGLTDPSAGQYQVEKGSTREIYAEINAPYVFKGWVVQGQGEIADPNAARTTVTVNGETTISVDCAQEERDAKLTLRCYPEDAGSTNPGVGEYMVGKGESFSVTATANDDSAFAGWIIQGKGRINGCALCSDVTVTLAGDATLTAIFKENVGEATLTMIAEPEDGGTTNPGVGAMQVKIGEQIEISATPNPGYKLNGWTASGQVQMVNTDIDQTVVKLDGDGSVTAHFVDDGDDGDGDDGDGDGDDDDDDDDTPVKTAALTLAISPAGAGETNPGVGAHVVTLSQAVRVEAFAADGFYFADWEAAGPVVLEPVNQTTIDAVLTGDATITAKFSVVVEKATLTMGVAPEEGGATNPGVGAHEVVVGETISIQATANEGYQFVNWSIDGQGSVENAVNAETGLLVSGDATVTANFKTESKRVILSMAVDPEDGGHTNYGTGDHQVWAGKRNRIVAQAAKGFYFVKWIVDGPAVVENPVADKTWVVLTDDATVTAVFAEGDGRVTMTMAVNPEDAGKTNYGVGDHQVHVGKQHNIVASAFDGYHFVNWTVEGPAQVEEPEKSNTYAKLTGDATVIANFEKDVETAILTLGVSPEEAGSCNPGLGEHEVTVGERVELDATPADGFQFTTWELTGAAVIENVKNASTTIVVNGDATVTAVFQTIVETVVLTVAASPEEGGECNPGVGEHDMDKGASATIAASPAANYVFDHWTVTGDVVVESVDASNTTVTANGTGTVTANFKMVEKTWTLTMAVTPESAGSTNPGVGNHDVKDGERIAISAIAAADYQFTGWTVVGEATLTDLAAAQTQVQLSGNATVTANFVEGVKECVLTMKVLPAGTGSTNPGVGAHTLEEGSVVAIAATPADGYQFERWAFSGGVEYDPEKSTQIKVVGDGSATAVFVEKREPCTLTVAVTPEGAGTTNPAVGSREVYIGEPVVLFAYPEGNYIFTGWSVSGPAQVTCPKCSRTGAVLEGDATITANFKAGAEPCKLTIAVNDSEQGSTNPGTGTYNKYVGDVVSLTAIPNEGHHFVNWAVDGDAALGDLRSLITSVTLKGDATVTANFAEDSGLATLELAVSTSESGTTNPGVFVYTLPAGVPMRMEAESEEGYHFVNWSLEGQASVDDLRLSVTKITLISDQSAKLTANFVANQSAFELTMGVSPANAGFTNPGEFDRYVVYNGQTKVLNAIAAPGKHFVKWSVDGAAALGAIHSPDTKATFNGNAIITAHFADDGEESILTVAAADLGGAVNLTEGTHAVNIDEGVKISAAAPEGCHFVKWEVEGDANVENPYLETTSVRVGSASATIKPVFAANTESGDVTFAVTDGGAVSPGVGAHQIPVGTTTKISAAALDGNHFTGWTVEGDAQLADPSSPETTMTVTGAATVTATFAANTTTASLTLRVDPAETGSTNPGVGAQTIDVGANTAIRAIPAAGYVFKEWTIDGDAIVANATAEETTATLSGDAAITAHFDMEEDESGDDDETNGDDEDDGDVVQTAFLTMAVSPAGTGTVSPNTGKNTVNVGESVAITATALDGYVFASWSVVGEGEVADMNAASTTITLTDDAVCAANFEEDKLRYQITVGSVFEIAAADVGATQFERKPRVFINVGSKRINVKILNDNKAFKTGATTLTCALTKGVPAGAYELYVETKDRGAKPVLVTDSFEVMNPTISSVSTGTDGQVTVIGSYFGDKNPKVWLSYEEEKGGRTRSKKKNCKIEKPLTYKDVKGRSGCSCMDLSSGASQLTLRIPKNLPADVDFTLRLKNKVGECSTPFMLEITGGTTAAAKIEKQKAQTVNWDAVSEIKRMRALRKAQLDAIRKLSEAIYGMRTNQGATLFDLMSKNPSLASQITETLRAGKILGEPEFSGDGMVTATCEIDVSSLKKAVEAAGDEIDLDIDAILVNGRAALPDTPAVKTVAMTFAAERNARLELLGEIVALEVGGTTIKARCQNNEPLLAGVIALVKGIEPSEVVIDPEEAQVVLDVDGEALAESLTNLLATQANLAEPVAIDASNLDLNIVGMSDENTEEAVYPKSIDQATDPNYLFQSNEEIDALLANQ